MSGNGVLTTILDPQRIVGAYIDAGSVLHGFQINLGQATTIDFPNATLTWITGMSPAGDMVGFYFDQNGASHGFVLGQGKLTVVDILGATDSSVNGIDPQGNVVGRYTTGGVVHGYYLPRPF